MTARLFVGSLLSFLVLVLSPMMAQADTNWVQFSDKSNVAIDKEWTITFNTPISQDAVNNENIYLRSVSGKLNPELTLSNDGKKITVKPPEGGYEPGEYYALYVTQEVTSQLGKKMEKGYKQMFQIDPNAGVSEGGSGSEPDEEPEEKTVMSTGTVTADILNVREKPTASSNKVGSLSRGDTVKIYDFEDYWAEIEYNGKTAYVHKTYMKLRKEGGTAVEGQRIVVDAGHGDHDPGANYGGGIEKEINLDVAQRVAERLKALGATPILTRDSDRFLTLDGRVEYAKEMKADLFVSVHTNAAYKGAEGSEVFYSAEKLSNVEESRILATKIQNHLVDDVGMYDRGVKSERFYVIHHNTLPSVLVELGFVTNDGDRAKLQSDHYRNLFSKAITDGIVDYFEEPVK
ncbi:N-acetylmuramoyl-L-alanine amidase [Pontibacillus sp. HMF3514]|uniref:N-acetylmuramoyl-L-alanine amidase n=1 Tax=Pontibacillus sp. HMF3514 TaxID=2692425 RepID=UPI0013203C90|nr:N-acetylmuramoyl-L-alanine amidase [Pontibacillus sp. HMF3514]QHE53610.1 SH3 domain-containing protein [Pontibacillus sp. HMF3514]